jgi:hypothetical protein
MRSQFGFIPWFFHFLWTQLIWSTDIDIFRFSGRIRTFYWRNPIFMKKKKISSLLPLFDGCRNEKFCLPGFSKLDDLNGVVVSNADFESKVPGFESWVSHGLVKNKPCLEWPICRVEKVIDLLTYMVRP